MYTDPQRPERSALANVVQQVVNRLPRLPDVGIPSVEAITDQDLGRIRDVGGDRMGCIAVVVRYRIIELTGAPPPGLANAVLAETVGVLGEAVRQSDLFVARPPDTLVVLAPGAEPLEGRRLVSRLMALVHRHDAEIKGVQLEIVPAFGAAYRSATPTTSWDIPQMINEARARLTTPSYVQRQSR